MKNVAKMTMKVSRRGSRPTMQNSEDVTEASRSFSRPPMQKSKKSSLIGAVIGFGCALATFLFNWMEISLISTDPYYSTTKPTKIKSVSNGSTTTSSILEPSTESRQPQQQLLLLRSNVKKTKSPSPQIELETPEENNSQAKASKGNDEFVPLDAEFSLHGKKGSWGWHLLSGEEAAQELRANENVCNKPFEHCCLGQGRQEVVKMDPHKALWKLINTDDQSLQLGTFGDVLNHYPAGQSQESMCTFAFIGDSLSSDSTMGAVCEALGMGYTLKSCDISRMAGYDTYGADFYYTCNENRYNTSSEGATTSSHFLLEKEDASSCPRVLIAYEKDIIKNMAFMPSAIVELGGLAIFNWGVRCNKEPGCLEYHLSDILNIAATETYRNWRFMFREHEPQHFNLPGGTFEYNRRHCSCSKFSGRINNWRNMEVASMIEARNLTKQIDTIPISAALEPLTGLHYEGPFLEEGGDCTHYVYDPHRLDVTWDALLTVLQRK